MRRKLRIARYIIYKETLIDKREHFWTFLGGFIGIGLVGVINHLHLLPWDNLFLLGSFGASAVLIYGVINSPLAQPRNLIGGHVFSAIIGVSASIFLPGITWLQAAIAVPLSIVLMQITKTLHPPGGATALIAVIGSENVKQLGFWYVLSPVFSGVLILLGVALVCNNMTLNRSYPKNKQWYKIWQKRYLRR